MKKFTKIAAGIALATAATVSTSAFAEVSYNVGYASEYIFRGYDLGESTGSVGVDYEESGFYVGAWAAEQDPGIEYDIYFGYGHDFTDMLSAGIGYTTYQYSSDADGAYNEINLYGGFGPVSLEYSFGEYDASTLTPGAPDMDYDIFIIGVEHEGFYANYGSWGDDFDGDYFDFGYGMTVSDIDVGIQLTASDEDIVGGTEGDEFLVFTLGYSW